MLKNPVHKPEADRSKTERWIRNAIFMAVIIFASIMVYEVIDAETVVLEATLTTIPVDSLEPSAIVEEENVAPITLPATGEMIEGIVM